MTAVDLLDLSCAGCKRSVRQSRAVVLKRVEEGKPPRCAYCSKELELPPDVQARRDQPPPPTPRVMGRASLASVQLSRPTLPQWLSGRRSAEGTLAWLLVAA